MAGWRRDNPVAATAIADRQRAKLQEQLEQMRSAPCTDCGVQYPHYVMEFDHARGEKRFKISRNTMTRKDFREELDKCDLVCANCHKIRTHKRRTHVK